MAIASIEKLGGLGNAHLFIFSEGRFDGVMHREHPKHIGVLSSMNFQDVIREIVPLGTSHPNTFEEMRALVAKAAALYPGEVIPFEVSDVISMEFN